MKKRLSDLANIYYGRSPVGIRTDYSDIPIYGTSGQVGYSKTPLFNRTGIVVGRKGTLGNPILTREKFWPIDTTYAVMAKEDVDTRWLYYHLVNFDLTTLNEATGVPSISRPYLYKAEFSYVSPKEQHQIAAVLSTLDAAIEQTEALIEKQRRIRQGLLHDLLTRGVDENGELRPVPEDAPQVYQQTRLGWIPKTWNIKQLRDIIQMITSGSRGWAKYYSEDGALFLRIGNLTREHINLRLDDIQRVQSPKNSEGHRTAVMENDLLISITADLGIIGVIPSQFEEAYVNQHIALIRFRPNETSPRWVGHYLNSNYGQRQFLQLNESGAKAGLNLPTVSKIYFPNPDETEREGIVSILDGQDRIIEKEKGDIAKLQHIKRGLMQDLLTGRVRVTPLLSK